MNIFKVLSTGDGRINETNVSAFLAFLLDPKQAHGLDSTFLEHFLLPLVHSSKQDFDFIHKESSSKIIDLSLKSEYAVWIEPEKIVTAMRSDNKKKRRDIDIVIEIIRENDDRTETPLLVIAIENKIRKSAEKNANKQLIDELDGLIRFYRGKPVKRDHSLQKPTLPVFALIFVTPDYTNLSETEYGQFKTTFQQKAYQDEQIYTYHYVWGSKVKENRHELSISNQLSKLLSLDSMGEIDPIHEHTKYVIKSFKNFIASGFKSYKEEKTTEKRDYSKYTFEGETYGKRALALAVIKKYVQERKPTFQQIRNDFPETIMPKTWRRKGVVCLIEDASHDRYFMDDPLATDDKPPKAIVVNKMWDLEGIIPFIKRASELGYAIKNAEQ